VRAGWKARHTCRLESRRYEESRRCEARWALSESREAVKSPKPPKMLAFYGRMFISFNRDLTI
jgi:hypothetical protein